MDYHKNSKAYFNYEISEEIDAGMVLTGPMIKSMRAGKLNITEAFCRVINGEMFLFNLILGDTTHNDVKLLLKKREIEKMGEKAKLKNMTIIPVGLSVGQYAKMKIALGRGKKVHDKREAIKKKDLKREMERN